MFKRILLAVMAALFFLAACRPATSTPLAGVVPSQTPTEEIATGSTAESPLSFQGTNELWWRDAVFYEVFVRSFYDTDGNGIGDFNGITQKLDYIQNLGVNALWLMPIFPSPSYHGYDVTDYFTVNPQYGSMEDFMRLVQEAHKRGIHIIIDLVINHTSDQHPWFKASKDPSSPYRDWYIWRADDPKYLGPWGERVWHPSASGGYYYGIFEAFMPDLNYRNPAVTDEIKKIVRFWLTDVGVDGYRLDAAKHLIEDGTKQENSTETHQWFQDEFYPAYKAINPNAMTVGELSGDSPNTIASYISHEQFDLAFNFQLAGAFLQSAQSGSASYAVNMLKISENALPDHQYATFLTNHDQNRVMSTLYGNLQKAKLGAFLLLTSPGTPFIYYGEEIGMTGNKPDENIRRPMQWSEAANAGFTTGRPWRKPNSSYPQVNVSAQIDDPTSLLSFYRDLISLRKDNSTLRTGSLSIITTGNSGIYASLRANENETILILANLGDKAISDYGLSLGESMLIPGEYTLSPLLGNGSFTALSVNKNGQFSDFQLLKEVPPYGMYILKIMSK